MVINRAVDLANKANPCKRNEEHKQELKRTQLNWSDSADEWLISQVGVSQTDLAANYSWQNNLSKTQTLMVWQQLFMKTLGSCKTLWMHP